MIVYRRLSGITFRQKLEHDAISEIRRKRNVRLQSNALAFGTREEIAKSCDCGIAAIGPDHNTRSESFADDIDLPILRDGPVERDQRRFLSNFSAEGARTIQKKIVEKAALDRDLAAIIAWKVDPQFSAIDGDEFDRVEHATWQLSNLVGQTEPLEHRPARRIDAIAADFFTRKFLTLDNQRPQSGRGAKGSARGTRRASSDYCYIDNLHRASV